MPEIVASIVLLSIVILCYTELLHFSQLLYSVMTVILVACFVYFPSSDSHNRAKEVEFADRDSSSGFFRTSSTHFADAESAVRGISSRGVKPNISIKEGNQHKLARNWEQAGAAFEQAAIKVSKQDRREHDAANNYAEAANCYRKPKLPEFTTKALRCFEKSALIFAQIGEFTIAARHLEDAGDLASELGKQTSDADNSREAIRLYMKATDFWNGEDSPASAAGSRTKAALLMADIGMLDDAAREFEDLGVTSQRHSLLGFGSKDHMFKCCLCHLSLDASKCNEIAEDLGRKCDSFIESDEQTLVKKVSEAWDAREMSAFDKAVAEFERLNNLDDWSRRRLAEIRKKFDGGSLM